MTDYNSNILSERAEGFDAYVQFHDGSHHYRLKSIQMVNVMYQWNDEDRYADDGTKSLVYMGNTHQATINLILSKSEVDTASTPTNKKTISYWIAQREAGNRVQLSVVQVFTSKAASSNILRHKFTMDINGFSINRNPGGSIDLQVTGNILPAGASASGTGVSLGTVSTFKQESS